MKNEVEMCKVILKYLLSGGRYHDTREVMKNLKAAGVTRKDVIHEARKELGVKTRNNGDGTWSWRLENAGE